MTEGQEVSSRWPGYRFFRRNPSFFRFWCAAVINRSGDSLDTIAHMWLVLELTGSTMMMGTIMVANMLPSIILGPFTGVLADRWDRKRLVVICDIMRGLVMAGVAALLFLGHLKAAYLYVSAVLVSVFEACQAPARGALIPAMVARDDLMTANSLSGLADNAAQLAGLAAAGAVIGAAGLAGAIAVDALTFWVSSVLLAGLRLPAQPRRAASLYLRGFLGDLAAGLRFIRDTRPVLLCIVLAGLTNFFLGPLNVLLPAFIKLELKATPSGLSQAFLLETAAMLLATLVATGAGRRLGEAGGMRLGFLLLATGYGLLYFARGLGATMVFLGVLGFGVPLAAAGLQTLLQKHTPLEKLGRVGAVRGTLVLGAMPLSTALAGILGERIHTPVLFGVLGLLILLSTLFLTFNRAFRAGAGAVAAPGAGTNADA